MRTQTLTARFELFVAAATIAAHASAPRDGFRQRDVRFFTELFSNWAECDIENEIPIQNVQIQRYLDLLVKQGLLKRSAVTRPLYRLSRVGLLELLTRLVQGKRPHQREHFLFLVFFVAGYRERLHALVRSEGEQFTAAMRVEVDALLDVETMLAREIKRTEKLRAKLETRIDDAVRTSELVTRRLDSGVPLPEIVKELEKKIPYELNNRKPLSELISSIQSDQRRWELIQGNRSRGEMIWKPQRTMMDAYLGELKEILKGLKEK
jgi:hypothetical protein